MYIRRRGFGQALTPPISGTPIISSLFGPRSQPTAGASTNHQGIDYSVPVGTPVLAAGDGTVTFAGVQSGFGNTVVIDNGGGVTTLYGHLSSIGVSVGETVSDGSQIALSGNTGTTSGPNLHFQVMQNGVPVDPTTQLAPPDTFSLTDSSVSETPSFFDIASSDLSDDLSDVTDSTDASVMNPTLLIGGALLLGLLAWKLA
jgi:murein DD-endopeptidase MepM/ murein hydrolase activator NlpD